MERITIQIIIEKGKTVFKEIREVLPLFQQTGDLTETLGQYPATINPDPKPDSKKLGSTQN